MSKKSNLYKMMFPEQNPLIEGMIEIYLPINGEVKLVTLRTETIIFANEIEYKHGEPYPNCIVNIIFEADGIHTLSDNYGDSMRSGSHMLQWYLQNVDSRLMSLFKSLLFLSDFGVVDELCDTIDSDIIFRTMRNAILKYCSNDSINKDDPMISFQLVFDEVKKMVNKELEKTEEAFHVAIFKRGAIKNAK